MNNSDSVRIAKLSPAKLWYVLLFSFLFDSYLASLPSISVFAANPNLSLIAIALLFIAAVFNSEETRSNLFQKLNNLQTKSGMQNSKHKFILYTGLGLVVAFEFINLFGKVVFQHFAFIIVLILLVTFSVYRHYKEHKKHSLLMKTDKQYFYGQIYTQKILINLLPGVLSRLAALITSISIYNTGVSAPLIFQYLICVFIFIQSQPE